jgi:hypothetical protein
VLAIAYRDCGPALAYFDALSAAGTDAPLLTAKRRHFESFQGLSFRPSNVLRRVRVPGRARREEWLWMPSAAPISPLVASSRHSARWRKSFPVTRGGCAMAGYGDVLKSVLIYH